MSTRRKIILCVLVLVVLAAGLCGWFFAKPAPLLGIQFAGYVLDRPYVNMSPVVLGPKVSSDQAMRCAVFSISNRSDYAVSALMTVRYTNGAWGAFVPSNVRLDPHTNTQVIGVIIPTAGNGPPTNYPASPDWTKPWRIKAYASGGPIPANVMTFRDKVTIWLSQHRFPRLGLFVSPRKVQRIDSDLIPPDSGAAQ